MNEDGESSLDPRYPERYPGRILLMVTGETPQVVTETLYALAVKRDPPFRPTALRLITTMPGKEEAVRMLVREGALRNLCRDYRIPAPSFNPEADIHVIHSAGEPLQDLGTSADSLCAADQIVEITESLCQDNGNTEPCAVHASLAGGRKTMSYYLGSALALFGRPQDRLSHVLVSRAYESAPEFRYPTPYPDWVFSPAEGDFLDAARATVELVELPFLRLRASLPKDHPLLAGRLSFAQSVEAVQRAVLPPRLEIDYSAREIRCSGVPIPLDRSQRAWYLWFARRALAGEPLVDPDNLWIAPEGSAAQKPGHAVDLTPLLDEYRAINADEGGRHAKELQQTVARRIADGAIRGYFDPLRSKLNSTLERALGSAEDAERYSIQAIPQERRGGVPNMLYGLRLGPENIHFIETGAAQPGDRL